MNYFLLLGAFLSTIFLSGCGSNEVKGPDWGMSQAEIDKLLAKEAPKLKRHEGEITGEFSYYIEGKKKAKLKETKKLYLLSTEFGGDSNLDCFVYKDRKDVASHVYQITNKLADGAKLRKYIKSRAGAFGEIPYLSLYTQILNSKNELKLIKVLSARYKEMQITCINQDMGYMKGFRRIVSGFLTSLNDKKHRRPDFEQIYFLTVGKNRIGYQYDRLTKKKGGGNLFRFEAHTIQILADDKVDVVDELVLEAIDDKLNIEEVLSERLNKGELVKRAVVRPEGNNMYSISLNLLGNEVQGSYPINNFRSRLKHETMVFDELRKNNQYRDTTYWPFDDDRSPKVTTYKIQKQKGEKTYVKMKNKNGAGIWQYNSTGEVVLKVFDYQSQKAVLKRDFSYGKY